MTPEGKVKAEIKKYLDSIGAYYFMPVQTGYGAAGLDFYCCITGHFVAIEAKAPHGQLSARQEDIIKSIIYKLGVAFVARSADDVRKVLYRHGIVASAD